MPSAQVLIGDGPDTPATSYRTLPRRSTLMITLAVVVVAAIAWFFTLRMAGSMSDMVNGLGQ